MCDRDHTLTPLDLVQSFGPLFPFSEYMLLNSIFISTASYAAIAVVLIVLVFPESMNHAFLASTSEILGKLQKLVEAQELVLNARPSDLDANSSLIRKVIGARTEIVMLFTKCTFYFRSSEALLNGFMFCAL